MREILEWLKVCEQKDLFLQSSEVSVYDGNVILR